MCCVTKPLKTWWWFQSSVIQSWINLHTFLVVLWQHQRVAGETDLVHLEPPFNNFGFVIPRHVGANACVVFIIVWRWKPKFDTGRSWAFRHINPANIRIGHIKFVIAVFKFHIVCTIFVAKRMQNQVLDWIHADNLEGTNELPTKRGSWISQQGECDSPVVIVHIKLHFQLILASFFRPKSLFLFQRWLEIVT